MERFITKPLILDVAAALDLSLIYVPNILIFNKILHCLAQQHEILQKAKLHWRYFLKSVTNFHNVAYEQYYNQIFYISFIYLFLNFNVFRLVK